MNATLTSDTNRKPTPATAYDLQVAYEVFNRELFAGQLPDCLITYQRHRGARGYYWPRRFLPVGVSASEPVTPDASTNEAPVSPGEPEKTPGDHKLDEIALNPDHFTGASHHGSSGPQEDVLSTLVHEMCHLWQERLATKKPKGGYHDKHWAAKMIEVGLHPSTTGYPGGKTTGRKCSHFIVEGGPFQRCYRAHLTQGTLLFGDHGLSVEELLKKAKKRQSKTKYTCPECNSNAWAKPNTALICGECEAGMVSEGGDEGED